jgi:acetyl esterase/lipase
MIQSSLLFAARAIAWPIPETTSVDLKTVAYASPDGKDLAMDLCLPQRSGRKLPVIVFLHGGGWFGGNRKTGPDFKRYFAQDGFAMAAIDYRLTSSITFPSDVEDVKTAIRWLKANATTYGLDADRIGIWGTSAGAHLGMIAALTPKGTFDGNDNLDESSSVRCVLDAYGPTMLTLMDQQTAAEKATLQPIASALRNAPPMRPGGMPPSGPPSGSDPTVPRPGAFGPIVHDSPTSPESRLLGGPIQSVPDKARAASPLAYVNHGAPPFLIMHGLADDSVPHTQSIMMYEALLKADCDVTLRLIDGLPHSFFNRTNLDELAGPFRMDVREHRAGMDESKREERVKAFDVARTFFQKYLG